MVIVQINATCGVGSTGKICVGISELLTQNDIENYIFFSAESSGYPLGIQCSNDRYIKFQALKSRTIGNYGFNSQKATKVIIQNLDKIKPDIVHIHNIHGHDCNLDMLFSYFKKTGIRVIWTFHDCWAFTGYCTHFTLAKCDKWKTSCYNCEQKKKFSWLFDKSTKLYEKKKKLFKNLDLTIVTPSQWLADIVKESFLNKYNVEVINNGIDLSVFKPTQSDFKRKYGIKNKKIVLGVSFGWDDSKGLDAFLRLADTLSDEYQIVLVGTDNSVDKLLPKNIISIHRTSNQNELAEIYSAADVFVNPTREDNYPTVNMESLACGTPVLTFRTGGSPEILDETCGSIVECDDMDTLKKEIVRICEMNPYGKESCLNKAKEFDQNKRFKEYLELYERIDVTGAQRD